MSFQLENEKQPGRPARNRTKYDYDNDGGVLSDGSHSYQYNALHQNFTVDSGETATYTYDGENRRAIKTAYGVTTYFLYDPAGRLITELNPEASSGAVTGKDYVYLDGAPIARLDWTVNEQPLGDVLKAYKSASNVHLDWTAYPTNDTPYVVRRKAVDPADKTFNGATGIASVPGTTKVYDDPIPNPAIRYDYVVFKAVAATDSLFYYHTDQRGTPVAMTSGSSALAWEPNYRPFGDIKSYSYSTSGFVNNLRFPGQYFDGETGFHQNWFRDYAPKTGRYREADPIGLARDPGVYGYARQNPLHFTDPTGLYTEIIFWAPFGWTSSSFGHLSSNVNGANFSWAPDGWDKRSATASAYAARNQAFRKGVGVILNLTPEQEAKLVACYARDRGRYGKVTNNCSQPQKDCLEQATGYDFSDSFFPDSVERDLANSPYFGGWTYYPGPEQNWWERAPWAW